MSLEGADVWLFQEAKHGAPEGVQEAERWAPRRGWRLAAECSFAGVKHEGAGADVAARAAISQGCWPGQTSITFWPGRRRGVDLSVIVRGGIAATSAYAAVGAGLRCENADMLSERLAKLDCLWVISGDFHMPPAALEGFARQAGGVVVTPKKATCEAGKGSTSTFSWRTAPSARWQRQLS